MSEEMKSVNSLELLIHVAKLSPRLGASLFRSVSG